ncbi:hypothetical protein AGMMS49957_06880 [Synergistales bacterium]|nr:hypothetical protein AGMMS49957_06880 [Synergistales bacterium]
MAGKTDSVWWEGEYVDMLLKGTIDGIIVSDQDDRIVRCSDSFLQLLNLPDESSVKGRTFQELYEFFGSDFLIDKIEEFRKMSRESCKPVMTYPKINFPGSTLRSYRVVMIPFFDKDGVYMGSQTSYRDVSDMMDMEDELTKTLLNATPMACSFWDKSGKMLDCNLEVLKMFGISQKSDYIDHFYDLSPERQPDGTPTVEKAKMLIKATFETGYQRFEWMYMTAGGEQLPVETTLVRVPYKDSYGLAAYSRDLREIKEKEEEAREAEMRVQAMLDSMPLACLIKNREGETVDCNKALVDLFECKSKAEYIENFKRFMPEYQPDGTKSELKEKVYLWQALETGKSVFRWERRTNSGEILPVEMCLQRVKWKDEHRVVGYMRDLRPIELIEGNLFRAMSLVEHSPQFVVYVNADGDIEYMNPTVLTLSGFSKEELLTQGMRLMFSSDDIVRLSAVSMLDKSNSDGYFNFEMSITCKNKERRVLWLSAFSATLRNGKSGIGITARDITDMKRLQDELNNLIKAQEQARTQSRATQQQTSWVIV